MNTILENVTNNFGGTIPTNVNEIITAMEAAKTLGNSTMDKLQAIYPKLSYGLFAAIKNEIQDSRKTYTTTAADARADRILNIRNSDGKATSRK